MIYEDSTSLGDKRNLLELFPTKSNGVQAMQVGNARAKKKRLVLPITCISLARPFSHNVESNVIVSSDEEKKDTFGASSHQRKRNEL